MEFVAFQAEQVSGDMATEVKEHKARLSEDLSRLSGELNAFLYEGLDHRKSLDAWVRDAKPFHWYAEFYGVIASGGFDVIIGNPPFVDYSEVKTQYRINGYKTEQCGNLYAFVVERALALLQPKGQFGMIVPLSVTFSLTSVLCASSCFLKWERFTIRISTIFPTDYLPALRKVEYE